jgi:hypothetical protein
MAHIAPVSVFVMPVGMIARMVGVLRVWAVFSIPPYTREMGITAGMSAMAETTWMRDETGRRASNPRPSETNLKVLLRLRLRLPHQTLLLQLHHRRKLFNRHQLASRQPHRLKPRLLPAQRPRPPRQPKALLPLAPKTTST